MARPKKPTIVQEVEDLAEYGEPEAEDLRGFDEEPESVPPMYQRPAPFMAGAHDLPPGYRLRIQRRTDVGRLEELGEMPAAATPDEVTARIGAPGFYMLMLVDDIGRPLEKTVREYNIAKDHPFFLAQRQHAQAPGVAPGAPYGAPPTAGGMPDSPATMLLLETLKNELAELRKSNAITEARMAAMQKQVADERMQLAEERVKAAQATIKTTVDLQEVVLEKHTKQQEQAQHQLVLIMQTQAELMEKRHEIAMKEADAKAKRDRDEAEDRRRRDREDAKERVAAAEAAALAQWNREEAARARESEFNRAILAASKSGGGMQDMVQLVQVMNELKPQLQTLGGHEKPVAEGPWAQLATIATALVPAWFENQAKVQQTAIQAQVQMRQLQMQQAMQENDDEEEEDEGEEETETDEPLDPKTVRTTAEPAPKAEPPREKKPLVDRIAERTMNLPEEVQTEGPASAQALMQALLPIPPDQWPATIQAEAGKYPHLFPYLRALKLPTVLESLGIPQAGIDQIVAAAREMLPASITEEPA